jgi:alkylation response protein AidB-like acyl-CoA dehydrogenase
VDFSLTDDQRLTQDEIAKALERISPLKRVREIAENPGVNPQDIWKGLCEVGIPGLLIAQQFGGLGLGVLDAALVAEQMGRFVVPARYVGSVVMAPIAISMSGSPQQQADLLPNLSNGSLAVGVGISEVAAGARMDAGVSSLNGRLSGSSLFVLDCASADLFIIVDRDRRLHLVEAKAAGLEVTELDTVDRTRTVCKLDFNNVVSQELSTNPSLALARMRDAGRVVLAADTLGAAWRMIDRAVEYAGQRKQFGRLIGSFQAVKHICADMAAELEPGRSLIWYAAYAQDEGREDAPLVSAHAKAYLSEVGRMVARKSTEVHGGIGITDELGLHYWFKRIGWNYQMLGSPERLRDEAAQFQDLAA